jgi:hypothetical protein
MPSWFAKLLEFLKKEFISNSFGIIHSPNRDLTYIRNAKRETKLCFYISTSWKLKSPILRNNKISFIPWEAKAPNFTCNRLGLAYA